jgi:hypothetical protein
MLESLSTSKNVEVVLYAKSLATNQLLLITAAPIQVYFIRPVQLKHVSPFVRSLAGATDTVLITMSTISPPSSSLYTDGVITNNQLLALTYQIETQDTIGCVALT